MKKPAMRKRSDKQKFSITPGQAAYITSDKAFSEARDPGGNATAPLDVCVPNSWNPNVVSKDDMNKLELNIADTLLETGTIPPAALRWHPMRDGTYEIVDGYHRKTVLLSLIKRIEKGTIAEWQKGRYKRLAELDEVIRERYLEECEEMGVKPDKHWKPPVNILKERRWPVCNFRAIKKRKAMRLTETLNHLRGQDDPAKYATFLNELIAEEEETGTRSSLREEAEFLPQNEADLEIIMRSQNIKLDDLDLTGEADTEDDGEEAEEEQWVDLKFRVPVAVAEIVNAELARIESRLEGKATKMRALEFMAVQSAQTPMESLGTANDDVTLPKKKKKGKKGKKA